MTDTTGSRVREFDGHLQGCPRIICECPPDVEPSHATPDRAASEFAAEARQRAKEFRRWVAADVTQRITDERRNQLIGGAMALEAFAESVLDEAVSDD